MEGPELYRDVRRPLWAMVTLTALPQGYAKLSGTNLSGEAVAAFAPSLHYRPRFRALAPLRLLRAIEGRQ